MRVLETIYLFYGEGERWTRGLRHDVRGKHCLFGAIELHCKDDPATMRAVVDYIGAAIWPRSDREYSPERLMTFNDLCSGIDRICDVLVRARALARRDMERQQPEISPEEMQRRRKHVRVAIADSRIEGFPPPSRPEQDIHDVYIRGEIEAGDLVAAYVKGAA
jgi:hypothetical protein